MNRDDKKRRLDEFVSDLTHALEKAVYESPELLDKMLPHEIVESVNKRVYKAWLNEDENDREKGYE